MIYAAVPRDAQEVHSTFNNTPNRLYFSVTAVYVYFGQRKWVSDIYRDSLHHCIAGVKSHFVYQFPVPLFLIYDEDWKGKNRQVSFLEVVTAAQAIVVTCTTDDGMVGGRNVLRNPRNCGVTVSLQPSPVQ